MKVIIARNSGFCDGVKRALALAIAAAGKPGGIAGNGPLVHNRLALDLLALHGAADRGGGDGGARIFVRAHGIAPEERRRWEEAGREIVDATCPRVADNQRLAREAAERGETVVLAGDREHAEIQAVAGSAGSDCRIVSEPEDIEKLSFPGPVFLLAQTTFNAETFRRIAYAAGRRFPNCRVADSICRATQDRQEEAVRLARLADVLVVVGGVNSANTRRLAEIGRNAGRPVVMVETAEELEAAALFPFRTAAVISGASTPGWITQGVVNRLRCLGRIGVGDRFRQFLHPLVECRLSTALSAGGLALAVEFLLLREVVPTLAAAGAGYVFFAVVISCLNNSNCHIREKFRIRRF